MIEHIHRHIDKCTPTRERERERKSFVMFSYVVYIYTLRDLEVGTESQECYSCDIRSDIQTTYIPTHSRKGGKARSGTYCLWSRTSPRCGSFCWVSHEPNIRIIRSWRTFGFMINILTKSKHHVALSYQENQGYKGHPRVIQGLPPQTKTSPQATSSRVNDLCPSTTVITL